MKTIHWLKSVQILSYFLSVFSCIQSECRKIRTRNNSVLGLFSRCDCYEATEKYEKIVLVLSSALTACLLRLQCYRFLALKIMQVRSQLSISRWKKYCRETTPLLDSKEWSPVKLWICFSMNVTNTTSHMLKVNSRNSRTKCSKLTISSKL